CGSGVTAAQHVLALSRIGVRAALYAGSWSEWIADGTRPVDTGGGP
ncbi:MAG: sulfurtransferase, partial [Actinobacteria bacterium]|nr:sulfurtransferase [Actinomycetota bacterium]